MSSNIKSKIKSEQVKVNTVNKKVKKVYKVKKEPAKQLKTKPSDISVSLRSIAHKGSRGCSNWKNFLQMGSSDGNAETKINERSGERVKLPLLKSSTFNKKLNINAPNGSQRSPKLTKHIGMDCEMVGIGENGFESIVARVSLVNSLGECVYDKYVKPSIKVTDYRTFVSGIRPDDLKDGEPFFKVQSEVLEILKGRVLVGHALRHDLQVLAIRHPRRFTRDTIMFKKFINESHSTMSLKNLSRQFLNIDIQDGEHNSIEDARAAMKLYKMFSKEWEKGLHETKKKRVKEPEQKLTTEEPGQESFFTHVDI